MPWWRRWRVWSIEHTNYIRETCRDVLREHCGLDFDAEGVVWGGMSRILREGWGAGFGGFVVNVAGFVGFLGVGFGFGFGLRLILLVTL